MKHVRVYEFDDLSEDVQEKVRAEITENIVCFGIDIIFLDVESGKITEDEAYEQIGCSRSYAESTSWFVPSVYYEKHKETVDSHVDEIIGESIFDKSGKILTLDSNCFEKEISN